MLPWILDDDDDEEFQDITTRDLYVIQPRINHLEKWSEKKFYMRFRLTKELFLYVNSLIEEKIRSATDRNHAITPPQKLMIFLRYIASGTRQLDAGDLIGVCPASACNIIEQVGREIANLREHFIKMPTSAAEIKAARIAFYKKARFPRCIASLDCTHINIQSTGGEYAEVFRDRKGHFSLNVQTVSSADLKILGLVVRYPGSTHDQHIFNHSTLKERLEAGEFGEDSLIVADGGYQNSKYIVTPLHQVNTPAEKLYQESIIRTRNPVERSYGIWKRRFPILALGMKTELPKTQMIITACAVLHNICVHANGDEEPPVDPMVPAFEVDTENVENIGGDDEANVISARQKLIENYFSQLL